MRRPSSSTNITSRHGEAVAGSMYGKHLGTDYAIGLNSPIVAPVAGTIVTQGWSDSVGNYIEIDGVDGRRHRLLHLNRRDVANGAQVAEGQQVGLSGSTGSSSTGPHIHWDARQGGTGFGDGFDNFVDTEALLAPETPPSTSDSLRGRVVYLKPVAQWSVYRPDQQPIRSQRIGYLTPVNYTSGLAYPRQYGLTYSIVRSGNYPNTVVINTQTYGQVSIYLDGDAQIL